MPARPIPRRTSDIELWDVNPVGTAAAWRREMLQFWSLLLLRGKRAKAPQGMWTHDEATGKNRPWTVTELGDALTRRLHASVGSYLAPEAIEELRLWLTEVVIVPGERRIKGGGAFAAGLSTPHYGALGAFNRSMTRDRFWAAFYYSAVATDLEAAGLFDEDVLAGALLERFALEGAQSASAVSPARSWSLDLSEIAKRDPETYLALQALSVSADDRLPSIKDGLPAFFLDKATPAGKGVYDTFLCPGTVIQMRRALALVLHDGGVAGRSVLNDLVETILANHGVLYFIRGMRVMNDLSAGRELPADCAACWARFQPDVRVTQGAEEFDRLDRWEGGDYQGMATAENARWVDDHCTAKETMFVNAGPKELTSAKELGRLSLEELRRQLAVYTVNRIMLHVSADIASGVARDLGEEVPELETVLARLDAWAERPNAVPLLASAWRHRIEDTLAKDADVPGTVLDELPARIAAAMGQPRQLEEVARWLVSEAILSARAFTRYIELLQSLLGGGALPSNQDPKGFIARGGSKNLVFHLSLRERTLETLTAIASLEAEEDGTPLSFQGFIDFLRTRYGILLDRAPSYIPQGAAGLVAEATSQSRLALRSRLAAMGLLEEYSDSSDWNRIVWREAER